jgi:hypothetical protein
MEKFARQCSVTGEGMNEGWVFGDGDKYAKYEHDAWGIASDYGYESIDDAYNDDACYWTEWEDEDDYQYQLIDGKLVEIED